MAAASNYGSLFTFNAASIGKCIVTGFPEVVMGDAETTNHSGAGYAESIPDGLVRVGDLTLSVLDEAGVYTAIRLLMTNKTVATAIVTNNIDTITGSGWIRSVKVEDADANDPDANKLTVVVACTGAWT
jgi:hypothetical protein